MRWSISNGNSERVAFARSLGAVLILVGFVVAAMITLISLKRGYRASAVIVWVLGTSTLVAAYKSMWVAKYEKLNVVRKIFDREVWIEEPALREIQDTIFIQALLAGVEVRRVLTVVFVMVPGAEHF